MTVKNFKKLEVGNSLEYIVVLDEYERNQSCCNRQELARHIKDELIMGMGVYTGDPGDFRAEIFRNVKVRPKYMRTAKYSKANKLKLEIHVVDRHYIVSTENSDVALSSAEGIAEFIKYTIG